jgi:hypothetical protein
MVRPTPPAPYRCGCTQAERIRKGPCEGRDQHSSPRDDGHPDGRASEGPGVCRLLRGSALQRSQQGGVTPRPARLVGKDDDRRRDRLDRRRFHIDAVVTLAVAAGLFDVRRGAGIG